MTISSDQFNTLEASKMNSPGEMSPTTTVRQSLGPVPIFSKINP